MSDNAELIEALGRGDVGRELLARLEKAAKGRGFASRCSTCGRWFVFFGFAHIPITVGKLNMLSGDRSGGRCRECLSPGPTRQHSTP